MSRTRSLALAATALFSLPAAAQVCSDNTYPAHLVTASGSPLPTAFDSVLSETVSVAANEDVYLAFDAALPSGTYYVHVTDYPHDGLDEVLSMNDPMDRFVAVTNTNGVITLSLPFTNNPAPAVFGLGLNGVGQSLRLSPFRAPVFSVCRFLVAFGNNWDLTNGPAHPWLLGGGIHPTLGGCAIRSYSPMRIGDGSVSDVTGTVYNDTDHDGTRDAGEGAFANWTVRLVTGETSITTTTGPDGSYRFENVAAGSYSVELTLPSGYLATTPASVAIQVCACANATQGFGAKAAVLPTNARTVSYWRNLSGLQRVQQFNILPTLPALHLVDTFGQYRAPGTRLALALYLALNNAWNMGYDLSAELVAMHCNVAVGFVHPDAVLHDPVLGTMTTAQLLQQAVAHLVAHPYTPPNSNHRLAATRLKNALARANGNQIWQ